MVAEFELHKIQTRGGQDPNDPSWSYTKSLEA